VAQLGALENPAAGDVEDADSHLAALEDLGAPTGYLVDILTEDDDTLRTQLSDAGLIILGDGPNAKGLRSALPGGALEGMIACFERGGVILGIGNGAAILGSFYTQGDGLGWVEKGVIAPAYDQDGSVSGLRTLLTTHPDAYGLGIGTGSALGLGPDGEVTAWGKGQVTIALGSNYG